MAQVGALAVSSSACSDSLIYGGPPAELEGSQNDLVIFAEQAGNVEAVAVRAGEFPSLITRAGLQTVVTVCELDGTLETYRISHGGEMKIVVADGEPIATPLRVWTRQIDGTDLSDWRIDPSARVLETQFAICPLSTDEVCLDSVCPEDRYWVEGRCLPCTDERPLRRRGECVVSCGAGEIPVNGFCEKACGDAVLQLGERCDDGNRISGDGCSAACTIESGWMCAGIVCTRLCGNGVLDQGEACDDANAEPLDGCTPECGVEPGWSCEGSLCSLTCSNGVLDPGEACDDGNLDRFDGCSPGCNVEPGWNCDGMSCTRSCSNGVLEPNEACDDGNLGNGDGCSFSCVIEPGWNCTRASPSLCSLSHWRYFTVLPGYRSSARVVQAGPITVLWGGYNIGPSPFELGGRYDAQTDQWLGLSNTGAPGARGGHTVIWTGREVIAWGGSGPYPALFDDGGRYDPATDRWSATSSTNAPSARYDHSAVWTGDEMIIWGGSSFPVGGIRGDGARYDPAADGWTPVSTINAPSPRQQHFAVWTGTEMIVWGGVWGTLALTDGARYDPSTDTWTAMSVSPITATVSVDRHGIWTGSELLVAGRGPVVDYHLYDPLQDRWRDVATAGAIPFVAGVWNGSEVLVYSPGEFASYSPSADSWTSLEPSLCSSCTEPIWTGSKLLLFAPDRRAGVVYTP